jgi:pimeloyl-ACP methyl ester carboxylesterase
MWSALTAAAMLAAGLLAYVQAAPQAHGPAGALRLAAGAVLVYAAVIAVFVAAYFTVAWIFRAPRPPQARIGGRGTLRLVWNEYRAILLAPWRMIFYRLLVRDPPPARALRVPAPTTRRAGIPVLLVHGVLCNAGVWAVMWRHLHRVGIERVYALSYGPPLASIDRFAEQLHAKVEAICAECQAGEVIVVAHSMGGLVALAYLRRFGSARVRRLVTIGTPWYGSYHAWAFFGTSLSQLRPGNAWLAALVPDAPLAEPPVVSIWSWHDSMVTPQTSSILPGATNVALVGVGHNALLAERQVLERVALECATGAKARTPECV